MSKLQTLTFRIICFIILICFLHPLDSQVRNLYVEGAGDQIGVIRTTDTGSSISGLEFLRGNEFNATDWRIINEGGGLHFYDGINNFLTEGDRNMALSSSGTLQLLVDKEASNGDYSGMLIIGEEGGPNLAMDANEILARRGKESADLYLQAGPNVANTYLNIASGNVGIGANIAPVKLTVSEGRDATSLEGGYLLLGYESGQNLVLDNNEIMSRSGRGEGILLLQNQGGSVSIGAPTEDVEASLSIMDSGNQLHLTNSDDNTNDWFIGASNPNWIIGEGKMVIGNGGGSNQNMVMLDRNEDVVEFQRSNGDVMMCSQENGQVGIGISDFTNMPSEEYLLAVDGRIIAEEVRVELSNAWPDYVFQKDYKLRSLREVERYIKEKGHLPNIPSAEEIENEGIIVGEMQRALMEKVEELTLYVIQLEKAIKKLENQ